jgi:cell division protein FtsQ
MLAKLRYTLKYTRHILAAAALLAIATLVWWIVHLPYFDFKSVEIKPMTDRDLRHVANSINERATIAGLHGNFFTADLEEIRADFETFSWVRAANVRREWPDKLVIEVEEHRALGTWGDEGKILSTKGDIFVANLDEAEADAQLYSFSGAKGAEVGFIPRVIDFQGWFASMGLKMVGIDVNSRKNWVIKLENGLSVDLGRDEGSDDLRQRFLRFKSAYGRLESGIKGGIQYVDMRYQNGMAVKPFNRIEIPKTTKASPSSIDISTVSSH